MDELSTVGVVEGLDSIEHGSRALDHSKPVSVTSGYAYKHDGYDFSTQTENALPSSFSLISDSCSSRERGEIVTAT